MRILDQAPTRRFSELEHASMRRVAASRPFDLLQARFITHAFAPHAHETYALGVCSAGSVAVRHGGRRHLLGPGDLLVLNPGEMHTGESGGPEGWTYSMAYPGVELVRQAADAFRGRPGPAPILPAPAVRDPALAAEGAAVLRILAGADPLAGECALIGLLGRLWRMDGEVLVRRTPLAGMSPRIRRVREYLHDHHARRITIAELAQVAGLSPYHLIRLFHARTGLPPYMYLEHVRIERAKALLKEGVSLANTAARTGFGDQSHFTRRFKRVTGVPPGRYARQLLGR